MRVFALLHEAFGGHGGIARFNRDFLNRRPAAQRVERRNPAINAFTASFGPHARADIAAGIPRGPFTGVPFALKDLFMLYASERTSNGSSFWADFMASYDSELFAHYRRAGFVIFGKTNTPECGIGVSTEPAPVRPDAQPVESGPDGRF